MTHLMTSCSLLYKQIFILLSFKHSLYNRNVSVLSLGELKLMSVNYLCDIIHFTDLFDRKDQEQVN